MADSSAVAGLEPASQVWTDPATGAIVGVLTRQGVAQVTAVQASGLPGTAAQSRLAGATTAGPPVTGTFQAGDIVSDLAGFLWVCTAAGSPGTWSAAPSPALALEPAGATAVTFPRRLISVGSAALTSGTLYVSAIALPQGLTVSAMTMITQAGVKTGGTHGWYALLDQNRALRAVTADQTDAGTVWGLGQAAWPLAFGTPYVTAYTGLYYAGVMVAETSGTTPTFGMAESLGAGATTTAPVLCGSSSAAQTTPPALGATMTAITPGGGYNFYACLS